MMPKPNTVLKEAQAVESHLESGGFILLPVLWIVSLLGIVALLLTKTVVLDIRLKTALVRKAEAEYIADGVTRLVMSYIATKGVTETKSGSFVLDGTPAACAIGDGVAILRVFDAAGQLDLNTAPPDAIERLLAAIGEPADRAARLAAAIVDFRTGGDTPILGDGRKAERYLAAGLLYGSKNAPLVSVDELEQVLGMDEGLVARLRPFVTVSSGRTGVKPETAQQLLLSAALPRDYGTGGPQILLVQARVTKASGVSFVREATMQINNRSSAGFLIRDWGRIDPDKTPAFTPSTVPIGCLELLFH